MMLKKKCTEAQLEIPHSRSPILLPNMNTGIKAPEGIGMVVETADIQNCTKTGSSSSQTGVFFLLSQAATYLHNEKEEEDDKYADMRMQPCRGATEAGGSGGP